MPIDFESISYYPALRTRPAEMLAYMELENELKDRLLPLITLGAWPKQTGIEASMTHARAALGSRPYLLDLTRELAYQNTEIHALKSSDRAFSRWVAFVKANPLAVPVVQMEASTRLPEIMKQCRALVELTQERVAFRIIDLAADTPRVVAALSALGAAKQGIVIIDLGLLTRDTMGAYISAAINVINEIRDEVTDASICVMSSSFPSSVTRYLDKDSAGARGSIPILERDLFAEIGADVCIYGDHASLHPCVVRATGGRDTPRIDFPMVESWEFERRADTDARGYVAAAQSLLKSYPEIASNPCWGARKIVGAAAGQIDEMRQRSSWIAARVNMHITRQLGLGDPRGATSDDEPFDD